MIREKCPCSRFGRRLSFSIGHARAKTTTLAVQIKPQRSSVSIASLEEVEGPEVSLLTPRIS